MTKTPVDEPTIEEVVSIDSLSLDDEFCKVPALLATANERYATALKRHLRAKYNRDRIYAKRLLELRIELAERGEKTTEASLKAHVEVDDEYQQAVAEAIEAEALKARLWGRTEAIRAKKDSLVSLGANMRAEMSGNPSIRGERQGARDVERNFASDEDFEVEIG